MSRWQWSVLLVLGVLTAGSMAAFVRVPGYMDSEYYYATAIELADGRGLQEPFLWNYLDAALSLPHPSHLYWMPLTSLLSAAGLALLKAGFRSAQLPFAVLAAGLPALTALVSLHSLKATPRHAFLAGLLAAFSGFYLPFLVTTDAFAPLAWIGTLAFVSGAAAYRSRREWLWLGAGLAAGAAQLTRADGVLLLIPLLALALLRPHRRLMAMAALVVGCAIVLAPWLVRNLTVSNGLLATGGARTLWLTRYDELFSYPSSILNPARWWAQGIGPILSARVEALASNLATLIVVVGSIVLGPFMLAGVWQKRREPIVAASAAYLLLVLTAMTVAFPFSGERGGVFHSSAAGLPILWALAPIGIENVLGRVSARRHWNPERAWRLFTPVIAAFAILISVWVGWDRVIAGWPTSPRWEASDSRHRAVTQALLSLDSSPGTVAINDPPGFHLASGLPCVVVPYGDVATLQEVADRFEVEWVVLDVNTPEPLVDVYRSPASVPWLVMRGRLDDAQGRPVYLLQVTARDARSP